MSFLEKLRLQPDNRVAFLQGFLRRPQQVGSIMPSSRFLERRILQYVAVDQARLIVELGPGTGGTTRALLNAMPADARLLSIDISAEFLSIVRRIEDPRLIVHHGSAADIGQIVGQYGLPAPDAVVSGIPFTTMPRDLGRRIVSAVREVLVPGGLFVAYQFRDTVAELTTPVFGRPEVALELVNVPPMRVYRWQKVDSPPSAAQSSRRAA